MKSIFTIRGIAIACVVLGHAIGWVYLVQSWYIRDQPVAAVGGAVLKSAEETPVYVTLHLVKQLTLFDVPAFLFASGFLLAVLTGREGSISFHTIGGWIKGLAIPFGIWMVINSLASWLPLFMFGSQPAPPFLSSLINTLQILYFIPLIIQFYLLSPFILRLSKTNWKLLLGIAAALQLANTGIWYLQRIGIAGSEWMNTLVYSNFFLVFGWAIYFPLGAVFALNFKKIKPVLQQRRAALVLLVVASGALSLLEMHLFSRDGQVLIPTVNSLSSILYAISATWLLLSLADTTVPHQKQWMNMGTRSLGIYLSHTVVLITTARALYHLVPGIVFQPVLLLVILFSLAICLPYLLGELLFRFARSSLYQYLFG